MKLAILLLALATAAYGYHILAVQDVPSKSHYLLMKGLVYPLLEAGHKVTWISTFPDPNPVKNLRYIDVSHAQHLTKQMDMTNSRLNGLTVVKEFSLNLTICLLETPAVRNALEKENFDAVITEWFFSDMDSGYAAVQGIPWIRLSGMLMHPRFEYLVDAVRSLPVIPALGNDFEIPMTLWQRILNTLTHLHFTYYVVSDQSTMAEKYEHYYGGIAKARGTTLPTYEAALRNISILMVNSHPSFVPAQSLPPNVVDIAGYHIDEDVPPLPKDLQELMDSSPQGVVYFSMGSVVRSSALPEQTKKDLITIFGQLPCTVLWKFEETLEDLPKNLHVRSWMPQASILAHPNIKVFITHGGLLSILESLHSGVPIIVVPVFGDQPGNAIRSVRAGHALKVDFNPPKLAANLNIALNEMLANNSYYERAKQMSKLFRNRPVSNKKLIQHYVELAIESRGAFHLRSKAQLYSWYQLWMVDQLAVLVALLFLLVTLVKKILISVRDKLTKREKRKGKTE